MSNLLTVRNFPVGRFCLILTAALCAVGSAVHARVLTCGDAEFSNGSTVVHATNGRGDDVRYIEVSARGSTRTLARMADLRTGFAVAEVGMPATISTVQCHVRVNVRPDEGYTRAYEFRQDGLIQVVEQYVNRRSGTPAMGFRSMMLFPRSGSVGLLEGAELTIRSGQVDLTFSSQHGGRIVRGSSGVVVVDGRQLASRVAQDPLAQAVSSDRGDLEIMNHPGLVLDLGFCDGRSAPHSRATYNQDTKSCEYQSATCSGTGGAAAAVLRATNGQTCSVPYEELFDYLIDMQTFGAGMHSRDVSCVARFKFSTDQEFASYIRAHCRDRETVDVTSLGPTWSMPSSGNNSPPLGFTHPPAGSARRVTVRPATTGPVRPARPARPTTQPISKSATQPEKASAGTAE